MILADILRSLLERSQEPWQRVFTSSRTAVQRYESARSPPLPDAIC